MDAVKFIKERNRMCKSFDGGCKGCPAFNAREDELCCAVGQGSPLDATAQIVMVEEWSAAHPRETRQSMFLKQWPEAAIDSYGVLNLCPTPISKSHRNIYGKCAHAGVKCDQCRREFWMQEVE